MASAVKHYTPVEVIKFEEKLTGVTLNLSLEEAQTLRVLVGNVLGDPHTTARKHTNTIFNALRDAGVGHITHKFTGMITFNG